MTTILLAISLISVSTISASVKPLSWVRYAKKTGPKKALDPAARVEYHGSGAYSAQGRLYFPTTSHPSPAAPARTKSRTRH